MVPRFARPVVLTAFALSATAGLRISPGWPGSSAAYKIADGDSPLFMPISDRTEPRTGREYRLGSEHWQWTLLPTAFETIAHCQARLESLEVTSQGSRSCSRRIP